MSSNTSALSASISDVSFELPTLTKVLEVLTLQAGFNSAVVVIGTTLLGIAAGTIGVFAVLRNRALMADALAHSALPGLGVAFLIGHMSGMGGKHLWLLLLGATFSGVLGILCVQLLSRFTRLREDAAIGAVLSCFFGAGVVLLSLIQSLGTGEEGGLAHFIYGQTAAMNRQDAYYLLAAAFLSLLVATKFLKEFRLICFDEEFAASDGWPVSTIDLLMMSTVTLVTVVGMQSVGLLLIVSFLVIPPASARFWTDSLVTMVWGSALIGGLSGYIGSALSALLPRLPAGAVIVLVSGMVFFVSFFFAPARGLISLLIKHIRLSIRITEDHLLRDFYENLEQNNKLDCWDKSYIELKDVPLFNSASVLQRSLVVFWFSKRDFVIVRDRRALFTLHGFQEASKRVRNHRLWEEYLVTYADMPISHIDFSADLVEHALSPDIVAKLEKQISATLGSVSRPVSGPVSGAVPKGLHPIRSGA